MFTTEGVNEYSLFRFVKQANTVRTKRNVRDSDDMLGIHKKQRKGVFKHTA
jgi:hypothetical protein